MQINREIVTAELEKFIGDIFQLPEVVHVKIRDVIIEKEQIRTEKVQEAMDKSYHDCCSDVDLSVLVKMNPKDVTTPTDYMKRIDRFGISSDNYLGVAYVEENRMYRIILKNGMRYDFGFDFEYDDNAPMLSFESKAEEYSNPQWPIENVNRFWFVQIQALGKLYRKDFLIGDHLANMNLNETLVQQMVLRDAKYGTNHHRYGYEEELLYLNHNGECSIKSENPIFNLIADKLWCAALTYDELTAIFYPGYKERSQDFFEIWKCYEAERGS